MTDLSSGKFRDLIARGILFSAIVLVPWTIFLAITLPSYHLSRHYRLTWVGFDIFLVLLLVITAFGIYRKSKHHDLLACATGVMLLLDGWFDVTGAGNRADYVIAMVMALVVTVPSGLFMLTYSASANNHAHRRLDASSKEN